jgi:hypothetical protein
MAWDWDPRREAVVDNGEDEWCITREEGEKLIRPSPGTLEDALKNRLIMMAVEGRW